MKSKLIIPKLIIQIFVVLFVFFVFSLFFLICIKKATLNREGLTIINNKSDAFCENKRGASGELDKSCRTLTRDNCTTTSCCVWTSDDKCVAGGADGPTFNSDEKGKTIDLDYYYFKEKCFGKGCK